MRRIKVALTSVVRPRNPVLAWKLTRTAVAVGLISTGVAFIYWPAAPIVAGVLVLADLFTD